MPSTTPIGVENEYMNMSLNKNQKSFGNAFYIEILIDMHSAYLWMTIEIIRLTTTTGSGFIPRASPSKMEWKAKAIIKMKGVKLHLQMPVSSFL
eukprot:CAMPEP_0202960344 /NCGR_PEP_ID=MMETSP1396-20130829/4485_1 /ASSEMBLY_ACC=CAM_ASM_000872 /TAXON_ID= /ORGANISM="Pseudokeronopsis sp., Strain Brazil" /LENGTH=93 /DNA_ID=CAMNT_0049679493 /DNA_START=156 /DNA_END=437 /DNA_ORIENTATION=+